MPTSWLTLKLLLAVRLFATPDDHFTATAEGRGPAYLGHVQSNRRGCGTIRAVSIRDRSPSARHLGTSRVITAK